MAMQGEVMQKHPGGRPLKFKSVKELQARLDEYFARCDAMRDLPTITELAVFIGTDRKTLHNYKGRKEFFPAIKEAQSKCEAALEKRALLGGLNATMAIFSLKNNYGWVDKTEVDNKHELVKPILSNVAKQESDTTPDVIDLT